MPLPLDLASVAWLHGQGITDSLRHRGWERKTQARRAGDLARVVADQQRYIRELEAMIRPSLVQPIGEQEGLAL